MVGKQRHLTLLFLFFLTCIFFVLSETKIDLIVHTVFERYGLNFAYEWASSYCGMLESAFIIVSALIVITYLTGVKEVDKRSLSTGLLLGFSVFIFDVNLELWFTAFFRELPALSEHWWWMWIDGFPGVKWTTIHQILDTLAFNVALNGSRTSKLKNILLEKDAIGQLVDSKSSWYGIAPVFYLS